MFKGGALMKAQTIEGPVGASPACCHSERSEESLRGLRTAMTVTERFFASLRMTLSWWVARLWAILNFGWRTLVMFKGAGFPILDSPFPAGRFRSVLSSSGACSEWKKYPHPRRSR